MLLSKTNVLPNAKHLSLVTLGTHLSIIMAWSAYVAHSSVGTSVDSANTIGMLFEFPKGFKVLR